MLWCACELQAGCLLKVLRQALSSQHMLLVTSWHMRMSISLRYVLPDSLDSLDSCTEIQRKPDCKPDDWRVDESHNDSTQNCERAGEQTSPENFESPNLTTLRKKTDLDLQAKLAHKTQTSHVKHLRTAPRVYLLPFFQPQNHQQIDPFFSLLQSVNESWSMKDMKAQPPAQRGQSQPLTVRSIQNMRIWSILYLFILDLVLWSLHVSIAMNLNAVLHFTPSKMRLKKHVQKYAKLMHSVQEIFVKHMYQNRMSHVHLCMSMHFYAFLCIPEA